MTCDHVNELVRWKVAVVNAETRAGRAEAAVARVEALADAYERIQPSAPNWNTVAGNIRAALRGDE